MKINKKDPKHWIILIIFTLNTIVLCFLRLWSKRINAHQILLYGHKLNGNLKALYEVGSQSEVKIYFLTLDPEYYLKLKEENINVLSGLSVRDMLKLKGISLIISDHGLHSLILLLKFTNIKFIDVWHGIPFKGFDKEDFKVQNQYDEVWVTSELLKKLYIQKFGFDSNKVNPIGYARTDILINKNIDSLKIKKSIGIPVELLDKKIYLFAPTWIQDNQNRNLYPFGINEDKFLKELSKLCEQHNAICLLRKHLNSPLEKIKLPEYIFDCSYANFPNAESILLISDILVCDWSSIAFDYLLLDRPTIFLDVPAPFKKGFSLDESYRFGHVVSSLENLINTVQTYLINPEIYQKKYANKAQDIKQQLYDNLTDGKIAIRSLARIKEVINS